MASSDVKHDYNMEAGLLSTHGEERIMTKEAQSQDSEFAHTRQTSRNTSCTRRGLIALAVVSLVGVGLVSIGGGVCPSHLRHVTAEDMRVKDAIHSHKPNLSDTMAQLARRQENNTPGASASTSDVTTDVVTETTTSVVSETTSTEPTSDVVTEPTTTTAETSQQTSTTNEVSTSTAEETTTEQRSTSSREAQSTTEQSSSEATTTVDRTTTGAESTTASETSSQPESTSGEVSSTATEPTKKTITTGTRTTSSAVPKTYTSTLENGGVTTLTSTSWVAVVPNSESTGEPNLQNAAPRFSAPGFLYAVAGMMLGGMFLL